MSGWMECFRGVVYPWHCDHLGHMNVQHYVGMFDQAGFHFLSEIGFRFHDMDDQGETLVDAQHTIQYKQEQRVGSLVKVESAITRIGTKSVTAFHRMTNTETGVLAATSEVISVYFDLRRRESLPIPDAIRQKMQPYLVEPES